MPIPIPKYGDVVTAGYAPGQSGVAKFDPNTGQALPNSAPTEPTVAQAYALPGYDGTYDQALQSGINFNKSEADQTVDENAIRASTLARFQKEIDATNGIYSQKLAEAKLQGQGRLGTTTAINARSGTLGSDFGAAATDKTNQFNTEINNSILDEQRAVVAGIMGKADKSASEEIAAKRAAKQKGYDDYIKFLNESQTRKKGRITDLAKSLITQGVDITKLSPQELEQIAAKYGTTVDDIKSSYADEKSVADAAKADAQRKIDVEDRGYDLEVAKAKIDEAYKKGTLSLAEKKQAEENAISWYNAHTSRQNADTAALKSTEGGADPVKAQEQKNEAIALARELKTAPGKSSAVGASLAKLVPFGKATGLQGDRAGFEAKLETLKSNLTLENLKLLKGSMSDKDVAFLNSIASSLSTDMSEAQFDKELDRIITKLESGGAGGNNTDQISELKSAGYTDEQIQELLK